MMELFLHVIGTQVIISSFQVEKIANTVFGINMDVNSIVHHHMIMLLLVSNGLQMVTILLLAVLKCLDFVINLDGHILSINHKVDQL